MPPFGHRRNRLRFPGRPFLAALVVFAAMESRSNAQPPALAGAVPLDLTAPSVNDAQDSSGLPTVPLEKPRPAQGPGSVDSFVDSLHGNDATFKVLVNQARILTLKQDITAGPNQPLIAVGDPTILDFTVVNSRQLRLIGKGVGVTDLAITTARNETYTFEIRVLADLTLIQDKLRATFPDASVKLSQIRDHFVVEGEARDQAQIARIIQTISAYLVSVYIEQGRTVTVGQTRQVLGALGGQLPGAGRSGRCRGCTGSTRSRAADATRRSGCAGNRARGRSSARRRGARPRRTRSPPTPPLPSSPDPPSSAIAGPSPRSSTCCACPRRSRSCSRSASPS